MKCLVLYNPNSGKGKLKKKLSYVRRKLEQRYDEVDIVATQSGKDMEERTRQGAREYDLIVFSGGDGTFNNVLQGVGEEDVQLGYLPTGTANDVAHSLGIPRSLRGALDVILGGRSERIDCMRVNGTRYVMYIAAAGTITSLTYETPQRAKRALGWFAYAMRGLRKNMNFEVFPVCGTCAGKFFETHGVLMFVMNGRSVAGFPVNRHASMQDGMLEVAIVKQAVRPNFFQKLAAYFSLAALMIVGLKVRRKDIEIMRGEKIRIFTDKHVTWDFDGEEGLRGDITVELLRRHVKLFVPRNKKI